MTHRWTSRMIAVALAASPATLPPSAAAFAQGANGPTDACMKQAYALAEAAEQKQLPDKTVERLDDMFNVMEKHCKALELPQAQATASKIRGMIEGAK